MVSRNAKRKTIPVNQNYWDFIEKKRKKSENLEDCLRRLTDFKPRKRSKSKLERSLVKKK